MRLNKVSQPEVVMNTNVFNWILPPLSLLTPKNELEVGSLIVVYVIVTV
jgi:hypothetical protein